VQVDANPDRSDIPIVRRLLGVECKAPRVRLLASEPCSRKGTLPYKDGTDPKAECKPIRHERRA